MILPRGKILAFTEFYFRIAAAALYKMPSIYVGELSLVTNDFCKEDKFSFKRQGDVRYGSIWEYFLSLSRHAWAGITPLLEVEKALGIEWISKRSWISEHAKGREQLAALTHFASGRGPLWGNERQLGFRLLWKPYQQHSLGQSKTRDLKRLRNS